MGFIIEAVELRVSLVGLRLAGSGFRVAEIWPFGHDIKHKPALAAMLS